MPENEHNGYDDGHRPSSPGTKATVRPPSPSHPHEPWIQSQDPPLANQGGIHDSIETRHSASRSFEPAEPASTSHSGQHSPDARKTSRVHFASSTSRGDQTRAGRSDKAPKSITIQPITIDVEPRPREFLSPTGDDRTADEMLDPELIAALEKERTKGSQRQDVRPSFFIGGSDSIEDNVNALSGEDASGSYFPTPSISRQVSPGSPPRSTLPTAEIDLEKAEQRTISRYESGLMTPIESRRSSVANSGSESEYGSGYRRPDQVAHNLVKAHYLRQNGSGGDGRQRSYGTGVLSNLLRMYTQPSAASSESTLVGSNNFSSGSRSGDLESNHETKDRLSSDPPQYGTSGSALPLTREFTREDHAPAERSNHSFQPSSSTSSSPRWLRRLSGSTTYSTSQGNLAALIGAAGNIAGAASPIASSIRPDPKRPGYGLSRFSLDTLDKGRTGDARDKPAKSQIDRQTEAEKRRLRHLHEFESAEALNGGAPKLRRAWSALSLAAMTAKDSALDAKDVLQRTTGLLSGTTTPTGEGQGYRTPRRRRRRDQAIYITAHISDILQRQDFILKLGRALLMFGAPSHRLEEQLTLTARVLDIECQIIYFPGVLIINFGDVETHTSEAHFVKQGQGLDLEKLRTVYRIHKRVVHDQISASEASQLLRETMKGPSAWKNWHMCLIAGLCSAIITPTAFNGSLVDALAAFPLGALLAFLQLYVSPRSSQYSNVFEISTSIIASFAARGLDTTGYFCFSAIASGAVVLILPGYIVLCGALELSSRNLVAGSVRTWYSVVYSLFLGFGLSFGANIYGIVAQVDVPSQVCQYHHSEWYLSPFINRWWLFFLAPAYLFCLSLWLRAPLRDYKQFIVMEIIGSAGYAANFYVLKYAPNRSDVSAAVGSFVVALLGNAYGKLGGSAFTSMVPGVMFLVPSGFAAQGGLALAATALSDSGSNSNHLSSGIMIGFQMVTVSVGIVVGLFGASLVLFPFGRKRGGLFSF